MSNDSLDLQYTAETLAKSVAQNTQSLSRGTELWQQQQPPSVANVSTKCTAPVVQSTPTAVRSKCRATCLCSCARDILALNSLFMYSSDKKSQESLLNLAN